ncbi:MAG: hypothetical protein ACLR7Z_03205 [Bilophila wadsworthia]
MTPFPNGTGPANAEWPTRLCRRWYGGTSAIGGARAAMPSWRFRRFTRPPAGSPAQAPSTPRMDELGTTPETWNGKRSVHPLLGPTLPFDLNHSARRSVSSSPSGIQGCPHDHL